MGFFDNPVKDADKIHGAINYKVLRAAWDSYVKVNRQDHNKTDYKTTTPAWFALFAVKNYGGKFNKFQVDEISLLKSFTAVNKTYDEIVTALSGHAGDQELATHILDTHPDLMENMPEEFRSEERINEYLINVIREYQELLGHFYKKYGKKIDAAVEDLEKRIANGEQAPEEAEFADMKDEED